MASSSWGAKIRLVVDKSRPSDFKKEVQAYADKSTAKSPIYIRNIQTDAKAKERLIRELQNYINSAKSITVKVDHVDAQGAIRELRDQVQTMLRGLNITGLKDFIDTGNIDGARDSMKKADEAAAAWAGKLKVVQDTINKVGSSYKQLIGNANVLTMEGDSAAGKTSGKEQIDEITKAYTELQTTLDKLKQQQQDASAVEMEALQKSALALQEKISLLIKEASVKQTSQSADNSEADNLLRLMRLQQQAINLSAQVQKYRDANSKAEALYGQQLDEYAARIQNVIEKISTLTANGATGDIDFGTLQTEISGIRGGFTSLRTEIDGAGVSGRTFFDTFQRGISKFGGWAVVTRTLTAAIRAMRMVVTSVKEVDAAMTELRKVTDLSEAAYRKFIGTAEELSKSIGATLADTINATADFSRLGYDLVDATNLAEAALVYKNVGDGIKDISEASESIISTVKAFENLGVSASNAMQIVDKFNEVGNRFAISSEGIGTALQKSASSMAAAGNSLDETIALITGMNAVVQNPEVVGRVMPNNTVMYCRLTAISVKSRRRSRPRKDFAVLLLTELGYSVR